jgi:hypothetical protein
MKIYTIFQLIGLITLLTQSTVIGQPGGLGPDEHPVDLFGPTREIKKEGQKPSLSTATEERIRQEFQATSNQNENPDKDDVITGTSNTKPGDDPFPGGAGNRLIQQTAPVPLFKNLPSSITSRSCPTAPCPGIGQSVKEIKEKIKAFQKLVFGMPRLIIKKDWSIQPHSLDQYKVYNPEAIIEALHSIAAATASPSAQQILNAFWNGFNGFTVPLVTNTLRAMALPFVVYFFILIKDSTICQTHSIKIASILKTIKNKINNYNSSNQYPVQSNWRLSIRNQIDDFFNHFSDFDPTAHPDTWPAGAEEKIGLQALARAMRNPTPIEPLPVIGIDVLPEADNLINTNSTLIHGGHNATPEEEFTGTNSNDDDNPPPPPSSTVMTNLNQTIPSANAFLNWQIQPDDQDLTFTEDELNFIFHS